MKVCVDGFELEGIHYRSLSAIAKKLSGVRWNPNTFFGLKPRNPKKGEGDGVTTAIPSGRCQCTPHPTRETELLPISLILPAGPHGTQVDGAVLSHPGIARAIRQGDLEVARKTDEPSRRSSRRNTAEGENP